MPERASVFERTQIGFEAAPGTQVPATVQLLGTSITSNIMSESTSSGPRGSRLNTTAVQNKEWSEAEIEQDPAQYTDLAYLFKGAFGSPTSSVVSGTNLHEWDPQTFTALTPKTMTVEEGGSVRAHKFGHGLITSLSMECDRDGVSVSGSMKGQRITEGIVLTPGVAEVQTISVSGTVSSGTYTLTFQGETTSAIAFGATAATVQTALLALPNLDTGDVVVTGGPLPTTPMVLTFGGQYASVDVPIVVVNSAALIGGGSYVNVQTTAGAPIAQSTLQPMSGKEWDLFVDSTAAGLGTTKLTRCFGCSWDIPDLYDPFWVGNTTLDSWAGYTDQKIEPTFEFTVAADSSGMAFLANLRAGSTIFPRLRLTGPTLGASTYLYQHDFAVKITDPGGNDDESGMAVRTWSGEIVYDRTWGKWMKAQIRNDVAALT